MNIQTSTGTVHTGDVVSTTYFDNAVHTRCGRILYQRVFGQPMIGNSKKTRKAVTCKLCKKVHVRT